MDLADITAYALALGVAAAIPGPGITALVARSIGSGPRAGFAMLLGLICGDLVYLSFAVFGLALLAAHLATFFVAIKIASVVWLLWLAWQFWHAERHDLGGETVTTRRLASAGLSGFVLTLGNPKTIAFYLALLPVVINMHEVTARAWATVLVPVTVSVLLLVGAIYVFGAMGVRRQLSSARAQRHMHRGAALAMAGAASTLVIREL